MYYLLVQEGIGDLNTELESHKTLASAKLSAEEYDNDDFLFTIILQDKRGIRVICSASQQQLKLNWA